MRVKWTEYATAAFMESVYSWYPDANGGDFDRSYEGEVIGTTRSFWGTNFLIVACPDGKIRECEASSATIISE